jgi:dynein heavy chain
LKYGPRSKLRRACSRFLRFSYLLDFIALDALANIYIESVKDTINKLRYLASIDVDYELRAQRNAFGEHVRKPHTSTRDLPFFYVNAIFEECDIPTIYFRKEMIDRYEPPPIGNSQEEDFNPTVHLELYDPTKDDLNDDNDENADTNVELTNKV